MRRPVPRPHRGRLLLLLAVAVLASACQVRVGTDVTIGADGSGRIALTVAMDEELAGSLEADGIDPFAGLEDLPDGWTVALSRPDGGQAATVSADFDDPDGLAERVAQLQQGLDEDDPVILDDVDLAVADDGSAELRARAGLRPPSSTGLEGGGVTFDGDALAALLEERGDEVLRVDLRVSMPGPVVDTDADEVDGRSATWHLPTTELVDVHAVSDPPADRTWWVVGGAALVGVAVGWVGFRLLRRRR